MSTPLRRLPIESGQPVVVFAVARLLLALLALGLLLVLGLPYEGRLALVLALAAVPWSLFNVILAIRSPEAALNPLIAAGDLVMLATVEAVVPESYGAVRFMALFFLAVHAHFQGERIGLGVALFAVAVLVATSAIVGGGEVEGDLLAFYEGVFAAAALGTVALVGGFRTAESASRLRARELSRRTLRAEHEIRRRVSESLHDGPVQELIGIDMVLTAARHEAERSGAGNAAELIEEARTSVARNVQDLRDEMLDLGPYAYDEFSYQSAVERCVPVWERRFGIGAELDLDQVELPSDLEGELFRITQEAVANAARHGGAGSVAISLHQTDGSVRLVVADTGGGMRGVDPLGPSEPGHIGLASMRERTEMIGGRLSIDSSESGTTVSVSAPMPQRGPRGRRRRGR